MKRDDTGQTLRRIYREHFRDIWRTRNRYTGADRAVIRAELRYLVSRMRRLA